MRGSRARLINAARRSMFQRTELRRKLDIAGRELRPSALVGRGKRRVSEKVEDAAHAARQQFRDNRWPIGIAAAAGVIWLFREPIKDHAPRVAERLRSMFDSLSGRFQSTDETTADDDYDFEREDDDEAPE